MGRKITWESNRELNKYDYDIIQYYKNLVERWNILSPYIKEPTDGRTNEYKAYDGFYNELIYMWDMIIQTQQQYETQIKNLEAELSKWTDQQKGRKPILTDEQKQQIINWKDASISNREIAKRLRISEGTIRNFLKALPEESKP